MRGLFSDNDTVVNVALGAQLLRCVLCLRLNDIVAAVRE